MTGLTTTCDHARRMATAAHTDDCSVPRNLAWQPPIRPDPSCTGCVTDADRTLWARIADEIDQHLDPTRHESTTDLFGDTTPEPLAGTRRHCDPPLDPGDQPT